MFKLISSGAERSCSGTAWFEDWWIEPRRAHAPSRFEKMLGMGFGI